MGILEGDLFRWLARRRPAAYASRAVDTVAAEGSLKAGRSGPLHKYLYDRYADAVVLTFLEIEDLSGVALPDLARRSIEWWTSPEPGSRFADSWIQAKRTALPNLVAKTVAFTRA
jgi:hypothetical protein